MFDDAFVVNKYGSTAEGNDFSPEKATYYYRVFLKEHDGKLVHGQFGEKVTYPAHSGNIINIRGMTPYPVKTTPLQEGVTPEGNKMNFYQIEAAINQYGAFTPITDFAGFASRDDVITKDAEALASQSGRTIDTIDRDMLNGGKSVMYAPAVASDGTVTEVIVRGALTKLCKFTVPVILRAATYLEVQNAEPFEDGFVAIIHPNVKFDVMNDPNFISIVQYKNPERIFRGEIGTVGNVRFVVSTNAKIFEGAGAEGIDVYSTLVLGKEAYKTLEIEGQGMKTIVKPLGSAGSSDPLDQIATQGWKTTHGVVITGETNMVRVESGATLNFKTFSNETLLKATGDTPYVINGVHTDAVVSDDDSEGGSEGDAEGSGS
jgi:N4-gp56 family major capsid protein